jgi:hypothetical protein
MARAPRKKKVVEATVEAVVAPTKTYLKEYPECGHAGVNIEYVVPGSLKLQKDGKIDMIVRMSHIDQDIPFAACPFDVMPYGPWLHEQALAGAFGDIIPYERPLPTVEDLQEELDKIMPDIILGLATEEELQLARALRVQIKAMGA